MNSSAPILSAVLLWGWVATPVQATPAALGQEQPPSLERMLRRARTQERALLSRLRAPVQYAVAALDAVNSGPALDKARNELQALGPEAAPLLVTYLETEPSESATSDGEPEAKARKKTQRRRAKAIGDALRAWGAPGITEDLVRLALGQDEIARTQAIRVLAVAPDAARARAVLSEILAGTTPETRLQAAKGLLELLKRGDQPSLAPLRGLLFEEDSSLISIGLTALAEAKDAGAEEHVRKLATQAKKVVQLIPEMRAYYAATESTPREPVALNLVQATAQNDGFAGVQESRVMLQLVADLHPNLNRELRAAFVPLVNAPDPNLQDEARLCLARLGDSSARRELLKKYDDWVRARKDWPSVYEDRAQIRLRLGLYGDAAKDCQTGIDIRLSRQMEVPRERYVELARARCLDGKLRLASKALGEAYLSSLQLGKLREDPDFRDLVESSRYGKMFQK